MIKKNLILTEKLEQLLKNNLISTKQQQKYDLSIFFF